MVAPNVANLQLRVTTQGAESFRTIDMAMDKTSRNARTTATRFTGVGGLNKAIGGLVPLAQSLAGPLALGAVTTALTTMARRSITAATEVGKLARNVGLPIEQIGSLSIAAERAGTDIGEVEGALFSFNTALGEARAGDRAAVEAFERLGVAVRDNVTGSIRDASDVLPDFFDALSELDAADRAEASMLILGESAARLTGAIDEGAGALTDYVGVFNEDFVQAAGEFTRTSRDIESGFRGIQNQITSLALPALNDVADAIDRVVNNDDHDWSGLATTVQGFFSGVASFAITASENFFTVAESVTNVITGIADLVRENETLQGWVTGIRNILGGAVEVISGVAMTVGSVITSIVDLVRNSETVRGWVETIKGLFGGAVTAIRVVTTVVGEVAAGLFDLARSNAVEQWRGVVVPVFNAVRGAVVGVVTWVTNLIIRIRDMVANSEVVQSFARFTVRVFNTITGAIGDAARAVGNFINLGLRALGRDEINFSDLVRGLNRVTTSADAVTVSVGNAGTALTDLLSSGGGGGGTVGGSGGGGPVGAIARGMGEAAEEAEAFSGFLEDGTLQINGQTVALEDFRKEHRQYLTDVELAEVRRLQAEQDYADALLQIHNSRLGYLETEEAEREAQAIRRGELTAAYEIEIEQVREKYQEILDLVGSGADPETILGATVELQEEVGTLNERYGEVIPTIAGDTGSIKAGLGQVQTETEGVISRAETLRTLFGTTDDARGSLRNALAGLIRGTRSWGEAFQGLIDGVLTRLANALAELATNSFFNLLGIGSGAPGLVQAFGALRNAVTGGGPALGSAIPAASFLGPAGAPGAAPALSTGAAPLAAPGTAGPAATGLTPGGVAGTVIGGVALGAVIGGGVTAVVSSLTRGSAGTLLIRRTEQQAIQEAQETVDRIQELAQRLSPYELAILNQPRVGGRVEEQRRAEGRVRAANPDADEYSRLKRSINENLAVRFTATRLGIPPDRTGRVPAGRITTQPADRQRALDVIRGLIDPTKPYARGGIVSRPTNALIGEAGPEAVVPLSGGRTIPVEIRGGGAGQTINITINQNFEGDIGEEETTEAARVAAREIQRAFLPGGLASASIA